MPIYECGCDDCGTKFEKLVGRSTAAAEAPMCPGGMCRTPGICGMN